MGEWAGADYEPVRATLPTARPVDARDSGERFTPSMPALAGWGPAWMYARADLRRRWKSTVAVAILIGMAGAVVLTAYAGARRTDSAYPRYLRRLTRLISWWPRRLRAVYHEPVSTSRSHPSRKCGAAGWSWGRRLFTCHLTGRST